MMRCRFCGRQLKSPASQLRGAGPKCSGKLGRTTRLPRTKAGNGNQPELFDTAEVVAVKPKDDPTVIDFDLLRRNV